MSIYIFWCGVQARFVRVASKLTPSNSLWTVEVVLEDDTGGQLNVKLNNQVLTETLTICVCCMSVYSGISL